MCLRCLSAEAALGHSLQGVENYVVGYLQVVLMLGHDVVNAVTVHFPWCSHVDRSAKMLAPNHYFENEAIATNYSPAVLDVPIVPYPSTKGASIPFSQAANTAIPTHEKSMKGNKELFDAGV